jgi:hypothetical protein
VKFANTGLLSLQPDKNNPSNKKPANNLLIMILYYVLMTPNTYAILHKIFTPSKYYNSSSDV